MVLRIRLFFISTIYSYQLFDFGNVIAFVDLRCITLLFPKIAERISHRDVAFDVTGFADAGVPHQTH